MIEEPERARATLVLLHGRDHEPSSMVELVRRLELPDLACVAPAAPDGSWYPQRFFEPREVNEPELSSTLDMIDALLDDLAARGVPPERTLLGGFSQGACLAAEALARRPRPLGALAVICGGLFGVDGEELLRPPPGSLAGLPVLLTGAEDDEWVPLVRVWLSADVLGAAGADVDLHVFPPGEHGIRDEEVAALRELVAGLLAGG
jgi:predicted esterase